MGLNPMSTLYRINAHHSTKERLLGVHFLSLSPEIDHSLRATAGSGTSKSW